MRVLLATVALLLAPVAADARPLIVGDSVTVAAAGELAHYGWGVDAVVGRAMPAGLQVLRRRVLPRVVVVALGTNGVVRDADLDVAERLAGRCRMLVLVTPRELGGGEGRDARIMRRAGRLHPGRVRVLDWARRSRGRDWFWPDGIHLKPDGARAFAALVRPARLLRPRTCRPSRLRRTAAVR